MIVCVIISCLSSGTAHIGRWQEQGMFAAYLDELLAVHMAPIIGSFSLNDVHRVRIFSHSGGSQVEYM